MDDAPLRFGVIGAGAIGLEHIRNLEILDGARVIAVADPSAESLTIARDLLCDTMGITDVSYVADYQELLDSSDVDAVIIVRRQLHTRSSQWRNPRTHSTSSFSGQAAAHTVSLCAQGTPNFTHIDVVRDALASSKHLLCEKPLCTTVEDCVEVLGRVRSDSEAASRRLFWTGLEYRYIPAVARLIREVDSGAVGDIRMVTIREHRFPFLRKVGLWNREKHKSGDTLVEKCCHFFDLMVRIADVGCFPQRVYASGGHDVNMLDETDILDNAFVMVEFDNGGPRMMLELCMFAEASKNQEEVSVVGDAGKLEAFAPAHQRGGGAHVPNFRRGTRQLPWVDRVTPPDPAEVEEMYEGADESILGAGYHEGATYFELEGFLQAVRNRVFCTTLY
jgi:predicted dehydrogenase